MQGSAATTASGVPTASGASSVAATRGATGIDARGALGRGDIARPTPEGFGAFARSQGPGASGTSRAPHPPRSASDWVTSVSAGAVGRSGDPDGLARAGPAAVGSSNGRATASEEAYLRYCADQESECLAAGSWGKRWTNDSSGRMFRGGPAGDLGGDGAPRWKQRALYDAIKDTAPTTALGVALARVSIYDEVDGVPLGSVLEGFAGVTHAAVAELVRARIAVPRAGQVVRG